MAGAASVAAVCEADHACATQPPGSAARGSETSVRRQDANSPCSTRSTAAQVPGHVASLNYRLKGLVAGSTALPLDQTTNCAPGHGDYKTLSVTGESETLKNTLQSPDDLLLLQTQNNQNAPFKQLCAHPAARAASELRRSFPARPSACPRPPWGFSPPREGVAGRLVESLRVEKYGRRVRRPAAARGAGAALCRPQPRHRGDTRPFQVSSRACMPR